ncbi:hypothetical protein [Roseobacter ponti]|uniref:Uncharacterized protein n=1 Tax=Roseobacter ponti TaxID=1891787 RepID=A0A858SRG9_9RHOB|nr:hypothetical protein [Roseobacter ponti]QJF50940.1 hypothetical protein G3256_07105 [Roseobacter ponti]
MGREKKQLFLRQTRLRRQTEYDLGGSEAIGCFGGLYIVGEEDATYSNFSVGGGHFGVVADNTKNVIVEDAEIDECKIPVTAHGSENFALLNVKINGWKLTDFTGDFDFLHVVSVDEVLHLGQILSEADVKDHLEILKSNKLYDFLESKKAKRSATAIALLSAPELVSKFIGHLIALAQNTGG